MLKLEGLRDDQLSRYNNFVGKKLVHNFTRLNWTIHELKQNKMIKMKETLTTTTEKVTKNINTTKWRNGIKIRVNYLNSYLRWHMWLNGWNLSWIVTYISHCDLTVSKNVYEKKILKFHYSFVVHLHIFSLIFIFIFFSNQNRMPKIKWHKLNVKPRNLKLFYLKNAKIWDLWVLKHN